MDQAFLPPEAEAMADILLHLNNLLLETGENAMSAILATEDPLLGVIN